MLAADSGIAIVADSVHLTIHRQLESENLHVSFDQGAADAPSSEPPVWPSGHAV